ncbi:MAG: hypothetical protein ACFFCM_07015, partial [Promethearchaeota archaeon]
MSNIPEEEIQKQIELLLLQAQEETSKYNWIRSIEILTEVKKLSIDQNLKEITGEIYYKLGEIYHIASQYEDREEDVLEFLQLAITYFQNAHKTFKELNNKVQMKASLGFYNFLKYTLDPEEKEKEDLIFSAKNYFEEAKTVFLNEGNQINSLKMAILENLALNFLIGERIIRSSKDTDFTSLGLESENAIMRLWDEIKKTDLPEIYLFHFFYSVLQFYLSALSYLPADNLNIKQFKLDNLKEFEDFIKKFKDSNKILCLFYACAISSVLNLTYAMFFLISRYEQVKHLKLAQKYFKNGEKLLPKIHNHPSFITFYFTRFTVSVFLLKLGYITRSFEHILGDLSLCIDSIALFYPKLMSAVIAFLVANVFLAAAYNPSISEAQRSDFATRTQELLEFMSEKIPQINDPTYKTFYVTKELQLALINALLGEMEKDEEKASKYLEIGSKMYNNISDYDNPIIQNNYIYLMLLGTAAETLAANSPNKLEQIKYYQKVVATLERCKEIPLSYFRIDNLFEIGNNYYRIGKLTNDENILKNSYLAYMEAINFCKDRGYHNLVGSAYINLAQIEDRLENYLSAAENYKKAIAFFDQAILTLTYTNLGKKIEKLRNYLEAWRIIELAKSFHIKEEHINAQINYEQASSILKNVREYKFEAPFYAAWSVLEKAEDLSKKNQHEEAAATYLVSKSHFEDAVETLNSYLKKKKTEDRERISSLMKVGNIRKSYCTARYQVETARLESMKGNHLEAAELYKKAGSIFVNLCQSFKIKRERNELTAIYYLCRAWEHMEKAEIEQQSTLYELAADLFNKASNLFQESRMKKLSLGNSLYSAALAFGSKFDKSSDITDKTNYYKKIKMKLRESSKNYQLGGFKQDAQWVLATSTFFDGIWHLIQS